MEDTVRLLFVAGLLVMSGVVLLLEYAIARFAEWCDARAAGLRPRGTRQVMKGIPARGTR